LIKIDFYSNYEDAGGGSTEGGSLVQAALAQNLCENYCYGSVDKWVIMCIGYCSGCG